MEKCANALTSITRILGYIFLYDVNKNVFFSINY